MKAQLTHIFVKKIESLLEQEIGAVPFINFQSNCNLFG